MMKKMLISAVLLITAIMAAPQMWGATCIEGPSLQETMDYITNALHTTGSDITLDWDKKTGRLTLTQSHFGIEERQNVAVAALYCTETFRNHFENRAGNTWPGISVQCNGKAQCVDRVVSGVSHPNDTSDTLDFYYSGDSEHAARLVRALAHLVYLLQQDFNSRHDDPKDPFARPRDPFEASQ